MKVVRRLCSAEIARLLGLRSIALVAALTAILPGLFTMLVSPGVADAFLHHYDELAPGFSRETIGFEWVGLGQVGIIALGVLAAAYAKRGNEEVMIRLSSPLRALNTYIRAAVSLCLIAIVAACSVTLIVALTQAVIGDVSVVSHGHIPASLIAKWALGIYYWVGIGIISYVCGLLAPSPIIPMIALIIMTQLSLVMVNLGSWVVYLFPISGIFMVDPGQITGSFPNVTLTVPWAIAIFSLWVAAAVIILYLRGLASVKETS